MAEAVNPAKKFYDRISGVYDALSDRDEHVARERGFALMNVQPGETALEIGFGTGHCLVDLAKAVGPDGKVCGIDISSGMEQVARQRLEQENLASRVETKVAAAPPLPYDDAQFDLVFLSFTLELFEADVIPQMLTEIRRVLKPGGRLGVVHMDVTAGGEHESMLTHAYKWLHKHFPHIVDCRPIDGPKFLKEAGYQITAQETMKIWTLPVGILTATPG